MALRMTLIIIDPFQIAGALQEFCSRWCKREYVESNAVNSWKLNILKLLMEEFHFIATV